MTEQIYEMAKCCPYHDNGKCHPIEDETVECDLMCNMFGFMANLEVAGYRKQSEGEWEKRDFIIFDFVKTAYRCTSCNTTWDAPTKFCPNCGAKMKGDSE